MQDFTPSGANKNLIQKQRVICLKKTALPLLALLLVLFFLFASPSLADDGSSVGLDTLEEIYMQVQNLHIYNPDPETLIRGAIEGLIGSLDDPYTEYLPPEEIKNFSDSLDGDYVGVGIQLQPGGEYPRVISTFENTPASEAGIKPDDLLIKVDGVSVLNEPLGTVVQKIRGPKGTKVRLTIRRQGVADFEVELVRASINTPTVSGKMLEPGIGYIRINTFGTHTPEEFGKTLAGLIRQGADGLILDLRDNPGGILQAAVQVGGNFLETGRVVVSTVDRNGRRQEYCNEEKPVARGIPVVVLVNHNSASAAEILAGALQDYGAAVLIGSQTYGKGTVQIVVPLETGGALKLTAARYWTPNGRIIDGTGLSPDIQVLTSDLHLAAAKRYLKKQTGGELIFKKDKPEALINGEAVQLRQAVLERSGLVYLPLRFLFEGLGYRVDWQADNDGIKISGAGAEVIFYPGQGRAVAGGQVVPGAAPLLFEEGAAFIPLNNLGIFNIGVVVEGNNIILKK